MALWIRFLLLILKLQVVSDRLKFILETFFSLIQTFTPKIASDIWNWSCLYRVLEFKSCSTIRNLAKLCICDLLQFSEKQRIEFWSHTFSGLDDVKTEVTEEEVKIRFAW